jgi:hypothetical protein
MFALRRDFLQSGRGEGPGEREGRRGGDRAMRHSNLEVPMVFEH